MVNIEEFLSMVEKASKWDHTINYKDYPLKYEISEDCDGMYMCEPYRTKLIKHWKFSTTEVAEKSAKEILSIFEEYVNDGDFVGADLSQKYLLAGSTKPAIPIDCVQEFLDAYNFAMKNLNFFALKEEFKKRKLMLSKNEEKI